MSREDAALVASRMLALLLIVWALSEVSHLPAYVDSFLHYTRQEAISGGVQYWRHHYLIEIGFLITRIVGFSLAAKWLYKGGCEVTGLFLPSIAHEDVQI